MPVCVRHTTTAYHNNARPMLPRRTARKVLSSAGRPPTQAQKVRRPKTDVLPLSQRRCQCQSNFFSVAKIAELLRSPLQRRSRVTIQNQEMIVEKEMFLDVDGKQVGMEMTECQLAVSSIGVLLRKSFSTTRNEVCYLRLTCSSTGVVVDAFVLTQYRLCGWSLFHTCISTISNVQCVIFSAY